LGLDLKGGMNVTLEVSIADIIRSMAKDKNDSIINLALRNANELYKVKQKDYIDLFGESFDKVAGPGMKLAAFFNKAEYGEKIKYNSTNEEVLKFIKTESQGAIDRSFNILRTRIDRFGVTQPNIQRLQTTGRILVELPGIKDPSRVRKLLQGTAQLEFWETYEFSEIYSYMNEANKKLAALGGLDTTKTDTTKADTTKKAEQSKELADNKKDITKDDNSTDTTSLLDKVKKDTSKTKKKSDKISSEESEKENPLFTYLRLPIYQNEKGQYYPGKGPVAGFAAIKDTAHINTMLNNPKVKALFPRTLKLLWTVKPLNENKNQSTLQLIALKITSRDGSPALSGDVVTDARQDYGQGGASEISMSMNSDGAKIWKRLTAANLGKSIAIALDNYVYSFPTVQSEIPNGRSQITGNFTLEEANDLANILKAGKLPAPAKIVEEAIVGPTLGNESINAGLLSFVLAFIMVLLYMGLYYNRAGWVANLALVSNVFFLLGVLASVGAVLTLPGIAGIVLTMGMAVDANVIIYERVREELRAGKGLRLAISDGYKHAYSAIIDSNVTTIMTGVVLFIFGSGPVQGFATTLIIGLTVSLFTAIFISRLIFEWMLNTNKPIHFWNNKTKNLFTNINFDFIAVRKKLYIVSIILISIMVISFFIRGLSPGVDFAGGRTFIVRFDRDVKTNEIRTAIRKVIGEEPEVKTFGASNQVKITTKYLIEDPRTDVDSIIDTKFYEGLKGFYKTPISYNEYVSGKEGKLIGKLSSQKVGPTIAKDLKIAAVWAVFLSLVMIFLYIAIRFKKWQWGLGGVISLFHDSIIVIGVYSLFYGILPFNLEVGQDFIAAILTIIGFSINDTVIIFDRIRENRQLYPKRELSVNINSAINSTLGRTINTSGTVLVVLLTMIIFGGEIIRGMNFALFIGLAVGTYSSVFNATPIAYDFIIWREKVNARKKLKMEKK
ncbi:MAG: protein translocase subunit SecDF, partial [Bacteroidales bacterium]|nr:protein translocase subunit SecDF [Bacteroidales bacterium]